MGLYISKIPLCKTRKEAKLKITIIYLFEYGLDLSDSKNISVIITPIIAIKTREKLIEVANIINFICFVGSILVLKKYYN